MVMPPCRRDHPAPQCNACSTDPRRRALTIVACGGPQPGTGAVSWHMPAQTGSRDTRLHLQS
eukprot:363798-Karenia_brevis.AAC.1